MPNEVWKSIPGYKGYEASNWGRIRSVERKVKHEATLMQCAYTRTMKSVVLKPFISTMGDYLVVTLPHKGKRRNRSVHILVCLAFNGLPPSKSEANALHKDGDSQNNKPKNLYWGTRVKNWDDMRKHGRDRYGEKHPLSKLSLKDAQAIYDARSKGVSYKNLKVKYGLSIGSICDIYKGRTWPQVKRI